MRILRCETFDRQVTLPVKPRRVVSLVAGHTEALWEMGLADRVVGVSHYCRRYVNPQNRLVAGDYLRVNDEVLAALEPDLILMTGGVQLGVARRLAAAGMPVYVLPLPDSFAGVLENIRRLGALMGEMGAAIALTDRMEREAAELRAQAPAVRPRVYAELWFGRHPRMAGGLTFIHDLISLAGGENIWSYMAEGYPRLDLPGVVAGRPEVVVLFHEEDDHPLDVPAWRRERGWDGVWPFRLVESGITRGRNLIHDGPSFMETARWLQTQCMGAR
ncbi:MAG: ABC transporter substrate-binding protein [Opitutaceae bacterium]|nr:ABC transporter substrate-binding protein [Opitutaceae bacterium]